MSDIEVSRTLSNAKEDPEFTKSLLSNEQYEFADSTYAIMTCSFEEQPKLISYNEKMLEYLCVEWGNPNWRGFLVKNLFYLIPFDEWTYLAGKIKKAVTSELPVLVKHKITRNDGVFIPLTGWITPHTSADHNKTLLFLYPVHESLAPSLSKDNTDPYILALKNTYNFIFEINLASDSINCIHTRRNCQKFNPFLTCLHLNEFITQWLDLYVIKDDFSIMKTFFTSLKNPLSYSETSPLIQVEFRANWENNNLHYFNAVAVLSTPSTVLLCISDSPSVSYVNAPSLSCFSEEIGGIPEKGIYIRTFGHFDVFLDGKPIIFQSKKEKELLALLVDRNGGTLTSTEAIECLWENEPISEKVRTRYRKLALNLKNTLAKYNLEYLVINNKGIRNFNTKMVTCDYYELMSGNNYYQQKFQNIYMSDYSWSESTLGAIWNYS